MKIIILSDDFPPISFGGAGIIAFRLAEGLNRKGHEVAIVTSTQKKGKEGDDKKDEGKDEKAQPKQTQGEGGGAKD